MKARFYRVPGPMGLGQREKENFYMYIFLSGPTQTRCSQISIKHQRRINKNVI